MTPGNPGQRTTESIFKQVTTSEIPELVSDLDGWGAPVLLVLRGLKKIHGVQGRKGIYFGKTWGQVATLWGKRSLESSYLQNSFPRVAKSYPKVLCFPFWPSQLWLSSCVMGNPTTLQIRGGGVGGKRCLWQSTLALSFNVKNTISSSMKDFSWKIWPKFALLWGKKIHVARVHKMFKWVTENI
jgi:hypothetical protein